MVVDAHQHFWYYDPARLGWIGTGMDRLARDWLPADLSPACRAAGVTATVAVQAAGDEQETAFLMRQAAAHDWIAGVVGWVDLAAADCAARIAHWQSAGPLVGLRHQLEDDPALLRDPAFGTGVAAVQRHSLVYDVLVNHRQLDDALAFCARHDRHWLLIDHLAKPAVTGGTEAFRHWRRAMKELAGMPHVAVKISGLATATRTAPGPLTAADLEAIRHHLDTALELFGERRLLFGSDWPVCRLTTSYQDWFDLVRAWADAQGRDVRQRLLGTNAVETYVLQPPGDGHGSRTER